VIAWLDGRGEYPTHLLLVIVMRGELMVAETEMGTQG
jgi:hypothetical protein